MNTESYRNKFHHRTQELLVRLGVGFEQDSNGKQREVILDPRQRLATNCKVGELRVLLRDLRPACRGAFAAHCTKDEAVQALEASDPPFAVDPSRTSHATLGGVLDLYYNRVRSNSNAKPLNGREKAPESEPGSEPAPDAGEPSTSEPSKSSEDPEALLKRVGQVLDKSIVDSLREAIHKPGRLEAPTVQADENGVTVSGRSLPKIDPPAEAEPWVPDAAVVAGFVPDAWVSRFDLPGGTQQAEISIGETGEYVVGDERVLLHGPPGCGKTKGVEFLAHAMNWPLTRFNGGRDTTLDDFVGMWEARDGKTEWIDGPLPRAMKGGHILLVDEVDHLPAEVSSCLQSVLEHGGKFVNTRHQGEVIKPHPNFRIVGTANTLGQGDTTGMHGAAQVQDDAFLSRWDIVLHVAWVSEGQEAKLLQSAGMSKQQAKLAAAWASSMRSSADRGEVSSTVSLRQTMAWARLAQSMGFQVACAATILNRVGETDRGAFSETLQRHFGDKMNG